MTTKERQAFERYILKCHNNTEDTEILAEGWAEAQVSVARNLLEMDILSTEQIAQVTGLTEKELESLKQGNRV